jgi:hypothetical protein
MIDGVPYEEYMRLNSPLHPDFGKVMAKTTDTSLLTNALRNRKDVATLSLLSGDPTVGKFGSTLYGDVEDKLTKKFKKRENEAQRALTEGYYDQLQSQHQDRMGHQGNVLKETIRHNQAMEEAALLKNSLGKFKTPPVGAQEKTNNVIGNYQNINNLIGTFKDEFANTTKIPGEGSFSNMWAKTPFGSEPQQNQSLWWNEYDKLYTLPVRNQMFGSALTATEKQAWAQANISPNSPPEVIKRGLQQMRRIAHEVMLRQARNDAMLYDPQWVDSVYSQISPETDFPSPVGGDGATQQKEGSAISYGGGESSLPQGEIEEW